MKKLCIEFLKIISCIKLVMSTDRKETFLKILSGFNILEPEMKKDFAKGHYSVHHKVI